MVVIAGYDEMRDEGPVDLAHLEELVDDAIDGRDDHFLQLLSPPGFWEKTIG